MAKCFKDLFKLNAKLNAKAAQCKLLRYKYLQYLKPDVTRFPLKFDTDKIQNISSQECKSFAM